MRRLTLSPRLLLAAVALAIAAPPLAGQTLHEHDPDAKLDVVKADKLFAEAQALVEGCDQADWGRAAELFLESAKLRPCHDPRVFEGMKEAAQLFYYMGHLEHSMRTMSKAAAHAMLVGDLVNASGSYLEAAILAAEAGNRELAAGYLARSEDLATSPFIEAADRQVLNTRVRQVFNRNR